VRREDIEALAALTEPVDELHRRATRHLNQIPNQVGNPRSIWSEQVWWDRVCDRIARRWQLDARSSRLLAAQLPAMVSAAERAADDARAAGADRLGRQQAMIRALAAVRRSWGAIATRIAVTETTRRLAEGRLTSAPGTALKRWVTEGDRRVRDTHREVGDQRPIPLNMPFLVGGAPMMFPGDPTGPPDEVVNCRCELKIVEGTRP